MQKIHKVELRGSDFVLETEQLNAESRWSTKHYTDLQGPAEGSIP